MRQHHRTWECHAISRFLWIKKGSYRIFYFIRWSAGPDRAIRFQRTRRDWCFHFLPSVNFCSSNLLHFHSRWSPRAPPSNFWPPPNSMATQEHHHHQHTHKQTPLYFRSFRRPWDFFFFFSCRDEMLGFWYIWLAMSPRRRGLAWTGRVYDSM